MAPRKKPQRAPRRNRAFNIFNFGFDVAGANQFSQLFFNQGLGGSVIEPLMNLGKPWYDYPSGDNVMNIKELIGVGILNQDGGSITASRVVGGGSGATTILKAIGQNVRDNAVPVAINLTMLKVGKKLLRKTGISRSLNRVLKLGGLERMVKF